MAKKVLKSGRNLSIFVNIIFVLIITLLTLGIMGMGKKQGELTAKLEERNSHITAMTQEKSAWEQEKAGMLDAKRLIEKELAGVRNSNHELTGKLEEVISRMKAGEEKIALLSQKNEGLEKIIKANQDSFEEKLREKDEAIAICTRANQELATSGEEQSAIIADWDKKLHFCLMANDKLLHENSRLVTKAAELETELAERDRRVEELNKENRALKSVVKTAAKEPIWIPTKDQEELAKAITVVGAKTIIAHAPCAIEFDLNKWDIRDEEQANNLKFIIDWVQGLWRFALNNSYQFMIVGYCSSEGGEIYNWGVVGSNRSLCIENLLKQALIQDGASEDKVDKLLRPVSAGKYKPENSHPEQNRVVKICLVKSL